MNPNDPWTELFLREEEIRKKIGQWETRDAPTALDLRCKEERLQELRTELDGIREEYNSLVKRTLREGPDVTGPEVPSPLSRLQAQEQIVLKVISDLGYQPLALPRRQPGKRWIKAEARAVLVGTANFQTTNIFDKTWKRLREQQDIKEEKD